MRWLIDLYPLKSPMISVPVLKTATNISEYRALANAVAGGAILAGGFLFWTRMRSKRKCPPTNYKPNSGRPLGMVEKLILQRCDRGNIIIGNMVCIGSKETLSEEKVREALRRLMNIHPLLRMRIISKRSVLWFEQLRRRIVPLVLLETSDWKTVLEDDIMVKFDTGREIPLWRVFYLPNAKLTEHVNRTHPNQCVLVFTFNHIIIDGISAIHLYDDLLNVMEEVIENKPESIPGLLLAPPLDEYIEPTFSNGFLSKLNDLMFWFCVNFTLFRPNMIKPYLAFPKNPWVEKFGIEKTKDPDAPEKTCILPYFLSKKDTTLLIQKCKENKVTVQAAVQAASSFAASKLYNELDLEGKHTNLNVECRVAVNVRTHFDHQIDPCHLGNYVMVSVCGKFVSAKPKDVQHFWSVAADLHQAIRNQVCAITNNNSRNNVKNCLVLCDQINRHNF